jgi:hypothetical protein
VDSPSVEPDGQSSVDGSGELTREEFESLRDETTRSIDRARADLELVEVQLLAVTLRDTAGSPEAGGDEMSPSDSPPPD